MDKNKALMQEVIVKHHPEFKNRPELSSYGLEYSEMFNIERLIEETLAAVGKYHFVDGDGYDFTDYSDSKTVTINKNTLKAEISSVENKIGALRITAFNPVSNSVDYFFVPADDLDDVRLPCYGKHHHKKRVVFQYNEQKDHYNQFEKYRLPSFVRMATSK